MSVFNNFYLDKYFFLSRDMNQIKRQLEKPHKELLNSVGEINTKIDALKQQFEIEQSKIDELQDQFSAASDAILSDLSQPRNVLFRFLFGLPLVGRVFRALFK
jgi:predicted  nucleic acid-binding Zn-ribbon protein